MTCPCRRPHTNSLRFAGNLAGIALYLSAIMLSGCTTRALRRERLLAPAVAKGQYTRTIERIRKQGSELYGNLNRFLYWYDLGLLFHYDEQFDSSRTCFARASQVTEELFARSVTNEALSLITNDNIRPYRPRRYEHILLHQFLAFSYLVDNELEEALVEARKTQQVVKSYHDRRIPGRAPYAGDAMADYLASLMYESSGETDNAAISMFQAVSHYRMGPLSLSPQIASQARDLLWCADRLDDIDSLGLEHPDSTALRPPCAAPTEIVLVGYAGLAPVVGETVFWGSYIVGLSLTLHYRNPAGDTLLIVLPAPPLPESEIKKLNAGEKTKAGTSFFVKFSIPAFKPRSSQTTRFVCFADSSKTPIGSVVIDDIGALIAHELDEERPVTLTRTALRVVLRTLAVQKAKAEMTTANPALNLLVHVGGDIAQGQLEKADTRSCFLLPQSIQAVRIPVKPGEHFVHAQALDAAGNVLHERNWTVPVSQGQRTYVFFPCIE